MITSLSLENFKGWQKARLDLGQLTILFGTNSSGKTSLIQSLLLLKQTVESYDRARALHFGEHQKDYVELGDFEEVVYGHDPKRQMMITTSWIPRHPTDIGPGLTAEKLTYGGRFKFENQQVVISNLNYSGAGVDLGLSREKSGSYNLVLKGVKGRKREPFSLPPPESCYGLPHRTTSKINYLFPLEFSHEFEELMRNIKYLGPLREPPDRVYTWSGSKPSSVGLRGENAIQAMLSALKEAQHKAKPSKKPTRASHVDLHKEAVKWLDRLDVAEDLQLVPIGKEGRIFEVKLKIRNAKFDASLADVGVGVSQVLPVIVQLYFAPRRSILIFEQPEIHLHPKVQAALADLFIGAAMDMGHQIIVESHSEHFLVRLQRRIAEAKVDVASSEKIKIYFCTIGKGESNAKHLDLDEFGRIEDWPKDFFGDTLGDREAVMRALVKRRKAEKKV